VEDTTASGEPAAAATAAAAPEKKKKKEPRRRTTLETKDPLLITPAAAVRIQELLSQDNAPDAPIGIRLGVKRRGCNGLSYTLNYATEIPAKDIAMESHGVKVFIEPMALFSIVGTTMDWEETELASEFTFSNPNSKGECGCGESFNV
jgi:iron-sulfur cluster assembly accessory protein